MDQGITAMSKQCHGQHVQHIRRKHHITWRTWQESARHGCERQDHLVRSVFYILCVIVCIGENLITSRGSREIDDGLIQLVSFLFRNDVSRLVAIFGAC